MSNPEQLFHIGIKAILKNSEGKYLCVKSHKGYFDLPGGRINQTSNLIETLQRELIEEAGITPDKYTISELQIPLWTNRILDFYPEKPKLFLVVIPCEYGWCDDEITLSEEHVSYSWESARDLYEKVDILQTIEFENIFSL
jgi:8-oxo-dGTP pyrophosphatase MutT (NUDIX family)